MKLNREFLTIDEGHYRLSLLALDVQFDVDRLRRDRSGDLWGELAVKCSIAGAETIMGTGLLSVGSLNLSNPTTRSTRARELQRLAHAPELRFTVYLEELCQRILAAEQAGQPAILLNRVALRPDDLDAIVMVHGVPIYRRHPIVLFGDGGTGKSTLALSIAGRLEQHGIATLYCDWELDQYEHRRLLGLLFPDEMPDLKYRRCERPLAIEVDGIAQQVRECGIDYLVCDSIAFACDGPPEAADVAQRYFRALRQLKVGSLNVAHITKGENGDQRPFGSTFWHNGPRASWYVERAAASTDDDIILGLFCRKNNLGRLPAPGLSLTFSADAITIAAADLAETDELAMKMPLLQRMKGALRRGPKTLEALADELGGNVHTLERYVRRHSQVFTWVLKTDDGIHRVGLLERRPA